MSIPARFSDGQYKNWLKCSQSLISMKEALHDYIDNEVKQLHGDITLKVSSFPCSSSHVNQCGCCTWKNIKLSGGRHGTWSINCKNSICDKWLHQILAVHDDPYNPTINWKNADISKWPSDSYHVAKIFMPKGQDKTIKMPDDLDAPAILSLMKYCNWFRKDLPNTTILSDLIDIRNKVLHSGDLRVSDSNKDSWIDLMIQLLSDLKINSDPQSELQMLKREDIDINFRETEIKVLQYMMSCLENDLTAVKEDMVCAQNLQSQLSQEVQNLRDNTKETTRNVDTLEADIERMKKSLDELKSISYKMVSFFDTNPDINDLRIKETIQHIVTDVQDQQRNLAKVETELLDIKDRVSKLEETIKQLWTNQEETNKELKGLKKRFEEEKENDEQLSLQNKTPREKRPETDGLRQLKNYTEDKLDAPTSLQYIPTKQAEEAKKLLDVKKTIVIKGNPGEGKTTTALHLIDNEIYRDKRVVLNYPKEWKKVDTDWVDIVVIEDVFGQFDLDPSRLQEWMVYIPTIQEYVDAGKIRVIVTTRVDILLKVHSNVDSLKLFSHDLSLTLSSGQLTKSEKMSIFDRELHRHKRNMKEDDKMQCIANFGGLIGFPQCCSLFSRDIKSFDRGPEFFRYPEKFFVANITELDKTGFLCLAFLFCNGEIWEEHLSPEAMPESSKELLMELAFHLHIVEKEASIVLLRHAYDRFLDLYVVKSMSYDFNSDPAVEKSCIKFTHATVCEAVGQVLGDRCVEMVVKYGNSEYLYQRTYTATAKDSTSQNVFIPLSVYRLLAKRMVHDVVHVNRMFVVSIVQYSALREHTFLKELKGELLKDNSNKSFFMPLQNVYLPFYDDYDKYDVVDDDDSVFDLSNINCKKSDSSEEECVSFMEYVLKSDEAVVRLVYDQLLEFLACIHNKNSSNCWQCREKQKLLELALYYNHSWIADKLITMNACYTHACLCNTARHGDLKRVQAIIQTLKRRLVFNPGFKKAKYALFRAYISGNQNLIEFLLTEGITLDSCHVVDAVRDGNMTALIGVVEHLKLHKKWKPHLEKTNKYMYWNYASSYWHFSDVRKTNPCSTALVLTCFHETFDMAEYLLKNEVHGSIHMFIVVSKWSSEQVVARMIRTLKYTHSWDPKCDEATEALEKAHRDKKYDICDLLVMEGVSLTMENLSNLVDSVSFEYIKKAIQNMKDTANWDHECDDASKALETAYRYQHHDVCDLLVQEGVSLKMKNLPDMLVYRVSFDYIIKANLVDGASFEYIKKAIQNMKDTKNWDPKCDDAYKAFENAYNYQKYDVCDLLLEEGVSLTMKNLPDMVCSALYQYIKKVIQNMKDTDNWVPKCDYASKALEKAYIYRNYDLCDLLVEEGVSLLMKNLPDIVYGTSFEYIKKAIKNMKDTNNWDPKCDDASKAFNIAYGYWKYDVCDLLVEEGASLSMKNLSDMVCRMSFESVKKSVQNMKDTDNWDPKCDDASNALERAYRYKKNDVCELLVQEGVSLPMKNLSNMVHSVSVEYIKKEIQNMKDTDCWDPKCNDASKALAMAYRDQNNDMCDLLYGEGVSLAMMTLPDLVHSVSFEYIKKAIQNMKDTENWDPKCNDASKALEMAYRDKKYVVCDMLFEEGVSLPMKNLPDMVYSVSFEYIKKAIQNMKDTDNWDPKCDDAVETLEKAYIYERFDLCDLLVQEKVSLTMKNLPDLIYSASFESVKKAIQNMKDIDNWDPKCDDASEALENAFSDQKYDVYDLLVHEGVPLSMRILPFVVESVSVEYVTKTIQNIKDTDTWNPKSFYASKALENAYKNQNYNVCDLLVQEGVSLTMKNLPDIVCKMLFENIKKTIKNMKDTDNWDPECDDASKALNKAINDHKYDVCDLLVQDGVSLSMKNLPDIVCNILFENIKKAIKNMKDTDNWDPECDDASKALNKAINSHKYDVCDLLVQEGVSLTMKNVPDLVCNAPLKTVTKLMQHLKDGDNWDPKCDDASKALENAYIHQKLDVCDLLVQEDVSLTMKNLCNMACSALYQHIKKAIHTMKDTNNWNPKCDDASEELVNIYILQKYDVCDLLVQEGFSLTMKNFPLLCGHWASLESVEKAIEHLEYTNNWDPKCDYAAEAFVNAFECEKYDVCYLLVEEGISLTMKNLPAITGAFDVSSEDYDSYREVEDENSLSVENTFSVEDIVSFQYIKEAIQNVKDNNNWDPRCDDASKAFENAYGLERYDVCDLLVQEGVSLTMKTLSYGVLSISFENIRKAIQNLKDFDNWNPKCDDASEALDNAYRYQKYDVCDLLIQEEVSLTMKNLPAVTGAVSLPVRNRSSMVDSVSFEYITKTVHHLKDSNNWDPKCDYASAALENAFRNHRYDVCDLLVQEGVSLTMKNLPNIIWNIPNEYNKKAIQTIKDNNNWYPACVDASKAFKKAYMYRKYDVCDLLFEEGVSLTMKDLPDMVDNISYVRKTIQNLKDTDTWDLKCNDTSKAFENAYLHNRYNVCDLLVQEGVSLTMYNLPHAVESLSFENIRKTIQNMKDNDNWDPKCDHASEALENAYRQQKYDVCDLLDQEGVSLTMNNLPRVIESVSIKNIRKTIQNMKDNDIWDPKCDYAGEALENAYRCKQYDVCDQLVQEGVSLTMKNLLNVVCSVPLKPFMKLVQHLKDTDNWDPKSEDASVAFKNAYGDQSYDLCDLLVQEGVLQT